jgi:hypothetical protein
VKDHYKDIPLNNVLFRYDVQISLKH